MDLEFALEGLQWQRILGRFRYTEFVNLKDVPQNVLSLVQASNLSTWTTGQWRYKIGSRTLTRVEVRVNDTNFWNNHYPTVH